MTDLPILTTIPDPMPASAAADMFPPALNPLTGKAAS